MGSVPRPKWVLANFSKSEHFRPYVDQELLYKHAYAASFKPILKSLRPSEAKGQSRRWVNMGFALLGFPHGKKNVSNRKSLVHTFGKVCAKLKFREYLKICRFISINVHK